MTHLIKYLQSALLMTLLVVSFIMSAEAQKMQKCKVRINTGAPKYKIGQTSRTVSGPPALVILISVNPKYFNRESMLALARRLNEEFCNEQRFTAMLFDNYSSAKGFVFHPHAKNFDRNLAAWRGNYEYDRQEGLAKMKFATERGKPRDEVVIDIDN